MGDIERLFGAIKSVESLAIWIEIDILPEMRVRRKLSKTLSQDNALVPIRCRDRL